MTVLRLWKGACLLFRRRVCRQPAQRVVVFTIQNGAVANIVVTIVDPSKAGTTFPDDLWVSNINLEPGVLEKVLRAPRTAKPLLKKRFRSSRLGSQSFALSFRYVTCARGCDRKKLKPAGPEVDGRIAVGHPRRPRSQVLLPRPSRSHRRRRESFQKYIRSLN